MAHLLSLSSSRRALPRERHAVRQLQIDDEPVTVLIDRLTVGELDTVESCNAPRGSRAVEHDAGHLERIAAVDRFLQPAPGEVVDEHGRELGYLASLYGARAEIVAILYATLLSAQAPSEDERHALSVAVRFSAYLAGTPSLEWQATGTNCGVCHEQKLCKKRHCDGSAGKAVVWHDAKHILKTCPVLSFTAETERILRLFALTHEFAGDGYRLSCLPAGTSLMEQEAWTIAALSYVRHVHHEMLIERTAGARG